MLKRYAALLLMMLVPTGALAEEMLGVQVKDAPTVTPAVQESVEAGGMMDAITQEEMKAAGLGERIMWRGMEGEDVKLMQRRLYQLGYYLGEVDGVFGLGTRKAVYGFQRAHKLEKIDGKVGPATLERMFGEDVIPKPTPTPSPTPLPTPTPVPSPTPTPKPDASAAPFALKLTQMFVEDVETELYVGTAEDGALLYPLCGVLEKLGYESRYEAGSWQLTGPEGEPELALMTDGQEGACEGAMGALDGVIFLTDEESRVYAYSGEAYVTAPLLEKMGVTCLLVGGVPVIHR
ncbi:MAG: peptidoglycan-binding domain-containing protein [Christensenellales bacterium]|nr:peptidoglycan-binding domain-containing protein [Christensenellales bacterium]